MLAVPAVPAQLTGSAAGTVESRNRSVLTVQSKEGVLGGHSLSLQAESSQLVRQTHFLAT